MSTFNHEEINGLEEQASELAQEAETHRRLVDYNVAMLMAFEEFSSSYKIGEGEATAAQANLVMSTAMESLGAHSIQGGYSSLSLEEIDRFKGGFFDNIAKNIGLAIKNTVDNVQTFVTLTNMQTSRLQKLKRSLAEVDDGATATFKVSRNKYMYYGNNKIVEDSDTYIQEFTKMTEVMREFCSVASDLNDESKFNIASYISAKATFSGNEFVLDHFKRMHQLVSKVISTSHLQKEVSKNNADIFATGAMVGMSQVVALMPKPRMVDFDDYEKARDAVRFVYLSIDRTKKFEFESNSRAIELTFTKKQIETLVRESESLLSEANKLLTFTKKFNLAMDTVIARIVNPKKSAFIDAQIWGTAMSYKSNPTETGMLPASFLPAIRIIMRYMNMTFDCTAGGYNFSLGNIKKALSITESFITKAD